MSARILLVEDELNVGSTLQEQLEDAGYGVAWAHSVKEADQWLKQERFDLAILDVGLPDGTGFDVALKIRNLYRSTAVVFLTAMSGLEDRIRGLELGAEDYIAKPFHLKELMLRIQNSLKRAQILTQGEWVGPQKIGEAKITFDRFEIERDGKVESLTHKECALLRFLFERNHRVASREDILAHVWLGEESPSTRTVDNFILRLRRWIEKDPENPMIIKTVRGVGYQMNSGDSK